MNQVSSLTSTSDDRTTASAAPNDFPPLTTQAWNLLRAVAGFVADGCTTVTPEQYRRRLEICDTCRPSPRRPLRTVRLPFALEGPRPHAPVPRGPLEREWLVVSGRWSVEGTMRSPASASAVV